jgi:hypothetical protein
MWFVKGILKCIKLCQYLKRSFSNGAVASGNIGACTSRGMTSLVVYLSEFLTTDHEVPGSIPGSAMGIFP